jgi:hypothetical protein
MANPNHNKEGQGAGTWGVMPIVLARLLLAALAYVVSWRQYERSVPALTITELFREKPMQ